MIEALSKVAEVGQKTLDSVKSSFDPDAKIAKREVSPSSETKSSDKPYNPDDKVEKAKGEPIQNKIDGLRREDEVEQELKNKYPEEKGYEIISEAYLRDKDGKIVKDSVTGEARRIDFVIVKDGKVIDSVEVTSKTADKTEQSAKEQRIRDNGGNYVRDSNGNLVEVPKDVQTRIERRA